jgi:prepilin-type N-terminal cleavage/methylation domain-containing protein
VEATLVTKPRTVDAYLASVTDDDQRVALEKLRAAIQAIVPRAEECFSYGLPAFRLDGKVLVGFGATAKHCAFYPMSGATIAAHLDDLAEFETSKGAIRFQPEKPLPARLVRKLVKARLAEIAGFTLVEMLIAVTIVLVLVAIAIPKLLPSRLAANEAAAIADLREAYQARGGSPFDVAGGVVVCPSPPGSFTGTKSGYVRGCTAGVYWATPEAQNRTGARGFGIDSSGRICQTRDGTIPRMASCEALR